MNYLDRLMLDSQNALLGRSSANQKMKHSGSIEHSFKKGSGEEIRGFSVDPDRAVMAYKAALVVLAEFSDRYAVEINALDDIEQKRLDGIELEKQAKKEAGEKKSKELDAKRDAYKAIEDRLDQLQKIKRGTFLPSLFFSSNDELKKLIGIREDYFNSNRNDLYSNIYDPYPFYELLFGGGKCSYLINSKIKEIEEKLDVAEMVHGLMDLSREDVLMLSKYEKGDFITECMFYKKVMESKDGKQDAT